MTSFDLVSAAAVLAMVGGLVAVLWEILAKDPRGLLEMMDDSRRFAAAPLAGQPASQSRPLDPAAPAPATTAAPQPDRRLAA
jgi:hypothetical protein